jgi:hypothetical protein
MVTEKRTPSRRTGPTRQGRHPSPKGATPPQALARAERLDGRPVEAVTPPGRTGTGGVVGAWLVFWLVFRAFDRRTPGILSGSGALSRGVVTGGELFGQVVASLVYYQEMPPGGCRGWG